MVMPLLNSSRRSLVSRLLGVIVLLAIAAVVITPNYGTGNWTWATPPKVPYQDQLRELKDDGLTIPDWQTMEQYATEISGLPWSIQALIPDAGITRSSDEIASTDDENRIGEANPAIALLRPQTWYRDMPQVEWMDINGIRSWTTDQRSSLTFTVSPEMNNHNTEDMDVVSDRSVHVHTRFFRGWSRQQTYAVMQWYAWPTGGSPSASQWFWVDQLTQLRDHHRMPWVAVSIMIPIKPLGDIQSVRSIAETIGRDVQASLMSDVFSEQS